MSDVKSRSAGTDRLRREDFALQQVPRSSRSPDTPSLFAVLLAIPSALVFFAVGGALGQRYGTFALLTGLCVASVIIGCAGWILTSYACRTGLDSDLISIRAGFGQKGSGVTSALYSVNFVVLFAIEASIIASAMHHEAPAIPRAVVLLGLAVLVLLLAWWGVASLARVMTATLPLFLVFLVLAFVEAGGAPAPGESFWSYSPSSHLDTTAWLAVLAALLAFIVNATVAADVGRFLKPERRRVGAFLFGGVLQVASFGGATLLGAWFSWRLGGATSPGVYLPGLIGGLGLACVMLSQLRINLINAYSGSLSLSNFAARLFDWRPGRHVWMIVLVVVSTAIAMGRVSDHLVEVLTFEAIFVMAWVSTLISYIAVFDSGPRRRDRPIDDYPAMNPVGMAALAATLAVAIPLAFGLGGELGRALAPLVAIVIAPPCVIAGSLVRGRSRTASTS